MTLTSLEWPLSLARTLVSWAVTAYRYWPGVRSRSVKVVPGARTELPAKITVYQSAVIEFA